MTGASGARLHSGPEDSLADRLPVLVAVVLAVFVLFGLRLFQLQILQGEEFEGIAKGFVSDGYILSVESFDQVVKYNRHGDLNLIAGVRNLQSGWSVAFFAREWLVIPGALQDLAVHALANALAAPFVIALVSRVAAWLGDDDSGRPVRLEPRTLAF